MKIIKDFEIKSNKVIDIDLITSKKRSVIHAPEPKKEEIKRIKEEKYQQSEFEEDIIF